MPLPTDQLCNDGRLTNISTTRCCTNTSFEKENKGRVPIPTKQKHHLKTTTIQEGEEEDKGQVLTQ
jgi:hypothetical protein